MPQNVLVSVLGEGEYLQKLIRAILEKEVVPQRNLFLSAKNAAACKAAEGLRRGSYLRGRTCCHDQERDCAAHRVQA